MIKTDLCLFQGSNDAGLLDKEEHEGTNEEEYECLYETDLADDRGSEVLHMEESVGLCKQGGEGSYVEESVGLCECEGEESHVGCSD